MSGSVIPLSYLLFGKDLALYFTLTLFLFVSIFEILRIRGYVEIGLLRGLLKPKEYHGLTGSFYFLLGSTLTIILFEKTPAVLSLFVLSFSDPFAQIVGNIFRGPKVQNKSLFGSLAFFLITFLILKFGKVPLFESLLVSSISTITEVFSQRLDDNLTVPLVTGFLLEILLT